MEGQLMEWRNDMAQITNFGSEQALSGANKSASRGRSFLIASLFPALLISPLGMALGSHLAHAGTILMSPDRAIDPDENEYPESRFGVGPEHGISSGFASREVTDMDETEDDTGTRRIRGSRGIASVSSSGAIYANSGQSSGQVSTNSIEHSRIMTSQASESRTASEMARKGVQEVAIIASDLGYFPKTVFVSRDVPVRMFVTGSSKNTLCIMMDSFQVRKQVRARKIEEITFTPNQPGKYRFYCPVNGMEGSLIVKEFSSTAEAVEGAPRARGIASTRRSLPSIATSFDSAVGGGNHGEEGEE
jgi:plastocyanin